MKKVLSMLLVLSLVIAMVVGCAKEETKPSVTADTEEATVDKDTEEATVVKDTEETEEEMEDIVLQAFFYDIGRMDEYNALFGSFTELYPNITVETTLNGVDYDANIMTMIASESMPDIIMGQYTDFATYGPAGHLIDITNEEFIGNYSDEIVTQMTDPEGKIYGLATNIAAMGYFYNQEMFEQAGIEKFPETLTEMQEAIDALIAKDIVPFSVAGAEAWTLGQVMGTVISSVVPDIMSNAALRKNNPDTEIYLEDHLTAFKSVDMQFDNAIESSPSNDYGTFLNDFASGKVAMIQMGTWAVSTIVDFEPDFTVRYGAMPYTENPEDVRLSANIGVEMAISSQTEYAEECLKLFEYLSTPEGNTLYGELFNELPAANGTDFEYTPVTSDIQAYLDAGKISAWSQIHMSAAGWNDGDATMQLYYFDQITAEEAITTYYENWFK